MVLCLDSVPLSVAPVEPPPLSWVSLVPPPVYSNRALGIAPAISIMSRMRELAAAGTLSPDRETSACLFLPSQGSPVGEAPPSPPSPQRATTPSRHANPSLLCPWRPQDDCRTITWKPLLAANKNEGVLGAFRRQRLPRAESLKAAEVAAVLPATDPDPSHPGLFGTRALRLSEDIPNPARTFSLLYGDWGLGLGKASLAASASMGGVTGTLDLECDDDGMYAMLFQVTKRPGGFSVGGVGEGGSESRRQRRVPVGLCEGVVGRGRPLHSLQEAILPCPRPPLD